MVTSPRVPAEESQSPIVFDARPTFLRLIADEHGQAQFVDWQLTLQPEQPQPHELSVSTPLPASAAVVVAAPAGGGHPQQPEASRQLVIVLSGAFDITASGQTRTLSAGDVILVEDTHGHGHSSTSRDGATARHDRARAQLRPIRHGAAHLSFARLYDIERGDRPRIRAAQQDRRMT